MNLHIDIVKAETIRLLDGVKRFIFCAHFWKSRAEVLPDVPTMTELGYPNVDVLGWYDLDAPSGTLVDIISTISKAAAKAVSDAEIVKHLREQDVVVIGSTPAAYRTFFDNDLSKWKRVAEEANISVE
ncbi:Bug family tripartite tricarboxylate transporter substrate binding protein [Paralcaligenes ureilyticus]|nr:tripartite tricarboxylate transporter substrate-binding protein [Paralcaligenes ureilyticus]